MINFKDEKGAALVLTLLMITLLLLFFTTLSGQVIQTTRQVTTIEKYTDAELISQMGVTYAQEYIRDILQNYEFDGIENLETKINETREELKKVELDNDNKRYFEIDFPSSNFIQQEEEGEKMFFTYTSKGTALDKTVSTDDTITIELRE